MFGDAFIKESARYLGLGLGLDQLKPGVLELRKWPAKGFTLFAIGYRAFDSPFHRTYCTAADDQTFLRQLLHHLIKAFALFLTQNILGRDFDVIKEQL